MLRRSELMNKIEIINLVPKFLSFYNKVIKESIDSYARWALWKERYRFSAVPPRDEGMEMARVLLGKVWE